jgi:hypothetical protein
MFGGWSVAYRNEGSQAGRAAACGENRRRFLRQVCAGAMAAAGSQAVLREAAAAEGDSAGAQATPAALPTIALGKHRLTRLIAGNNPVGGFSHSTQNLSRHMLEYFTLERTVEYVRRCESAGINTWQLSWGPKMNAALRALREQGSKIQWMTLHTGGLDDAATREILALKPIAIVHHGVATDTSFRTGKPGRVHDFVKKVHDAGVMAGVSSHNPANIAAIEEQGWENDFFMTCFYNVMRPQTEIQKKLGTTLLDEPFLASDRDEMTQVVQKVKRPCLGFKILAAGRLCWNETQVEGAFKYAFSRIKKTDAVIVGMYPRFSDEIAQNVQLALKFGGPA